MKIITSLFLTILCSQLFAQIQLQKSQVNAAGGTLENGNYKTSFSVGAPVNGTLQDGGNNFKTVIGFYPISFGNSSAPSNETNITAFSFTTQADVATIDDNVHTVTISVDFGTGLTNLVADFTLSTGATAKVGGNIQTSGNSAIDFSNSATTPVIYTITAEDGLTVQDWEVTVTEAPNTTTNILTYSIPNQVGNSTIDTGAPGVSLTMPFGTPLSVLIADFTLSEGATAKVGAVSQTSGSTQNDFTTAVIYDLTAQDGISTEAWTVTVTAASTSDTTPPAISAFSPADDAVGIANDTDLTITFDEDIQKGVGDIIIKQDDVTNYTIDVADASVTVSGTIVTISNPGAFNNRAIVNIEMAAGVFKDLANNDFIEITDATTWNFKITSPAAVINSFTPTSGTINAEVVISGANFSNLETNNIIKFNGTVAAAAQTSDSVLLVNVPSGATTGPITVEVDGETAAASASDFTVTAPSLEITNESFPTTYNKGATLAASIIVNDVSSISEVNFKTRGISEGDNALSSSVVAGDGNTYQVILNSSELKDEIGQYYYFEVLDKSTPAEIVNSSTATAYVTFPEGATSQAIPSLSFGALVSNYQIIAVPIDLNDKKVISVFSALMPYDKTIWRLFDFANGDNREYSGFTNIATGKGYWFIARNSKTINPGSGTSVRVSDTNPFQLTLAPGWNLIGNPYNFRISWDDVLNANGNPADIGELNTFSGGTLSTSTTLDRYRGGFVFNGGSSTTIDIPVTRNTSLGGRKWSKQQNSKLGDPQWELTLNLTNGELNNLLGGIGMHPNATIIGKDDYDQVSVPMIEGMGFFEVAFDHPEYKAKFNREIVPTQDQYKWDMEILRDITDQTLTLTWDNQTLGDSEYQMYLMDMSTLQSINMRTENKMTIGKETKKIRIFYGKSDYVDEQINSLFPSFGEPYPNPAFDYVTIPFKVPASDTRTPVSFTIYDNTGKLVGRHSEMYQQGTHQLDWKFDRQGMYIIQLKMGDVIKNNKIIIR